MSIEKGIEKNSVNLVLRSVPSRSYVFAALTLSDYLRSTRVYNFSRTIDTVCLRLGCSITFDDILDLLLVFLDVNLAGKATSVADLPPAKNLWKNPGRN